MPCSGESHPDCVHLTAILKEIPDAWPQLIPQIGELFELSHGVERAVRLEQKGGRRYLTLGLSHLLLTHSIATEPFKT